jgi:hypothetical protein
MHSSKRKGSLSRRQQRRKTLLGHLEKHDLQNLRQLAKTENWVFSTLVSLLLQEDDLLRWRAVQALGLLAQDISKTDLEGVREMVRRQLWAMNDESGNIAWHAPEVIGEILYNVPEITEEYTSILASFAELYPFQEGVHWALCRIADQRADLLINSSNKIVAGLKNSSAIIRGHAACTLAKLNPPKIPEELHQLTGDQADLCMYNFLTGELERTTVGRLAQEALNLLTTPTHNQTSLAKGVFHVQTL